MGNVIPIPITKREKIAAKSEMCRRSLFYFMQQFWGEIVVDDPVWNWHIPFLCHELQKVFRVASERFKPTQPVAKEEQPETYDLIINVPPGSSKSLTTTVFFPVWCWLSAPWMRFINGSHSATLSFDHAELSRDLVKSDKFKAFFPGFRIRADKDRGGNYKVEHYDIEKKRWIFGGNRYATSVGGGVTGMHAHIIIVDDPIDPEDAVSEAAIKTANRWIDQTLSTRKVDKDITPTILIMQRLAQDDPTGHILENQKHYLRHICLPGELGDYAQYVKPEWLKEHYQDGLLDPQRLSRSALQKSMEKLGQYGYAGQIGQNPVPPGAGMFQVDKLRIIDSLPRTEKVVKHVRYWDKGGTEGGGAYTAGVKMAQLANGRYVVENVTRGQWGTAVRESNIKLTAETDGVHTTVYVEMEPGSGGKESAENTIMNLAGFSVYADRPTGDKVYRADPFSVQVNNGNVLLLRGEWNPAYIDEMRFFPFSKYKDQIDASSGAFSKLRFAKQAGVW